MRCSLQRRLFITVSVFAAGLLVLVGLWGTRSGRGPKQFEVKDRAFHLTTSAITTGRTHTIVSGNKLLGWVNRGLIGCGFHQLSRDQVYSIGVRQSETLLGIGYRLEGDVLRLYPNGYSYPSTTEQLKAALLVPGGGSIELECAASSYMPVPKEYVNWWVLPKRSTNFSGGVVRLSRKSSGEPVADYHLQ